MSRKIRTLTLKTIEVQELIDHRDHRDHDPRPYVRERCSALLKIAEGHSAHGWPKTGCSKHVTQIPSTIG